MRIIKHITQMKGFHFIFFTENMSNKKISTILIYFPSFSEWQQCKQYYNLKRKKAFYWLIGFVLSICRLRFYYFHCSTSFSVQIFILHELNFSQNGFSILNPFHKKKIMKKEFQDIFKKKRILRGYTFFFNSSESKKNIYWNILFRIHFNVSSTIKPTIVFKKCKMGSR